ncbi:Sensor histidine kinase [Rickettsiales bacterium Ac37b]|nr:Sensor histidine kinase [Rickettsiales bacterium Ac37b]
MSNNRYYSLWTRFIVITILFGFVLLSYVTWKFEDIRRQSVLVRLMSSADIIEKHLTHTITYTENKMRFLGEIIDDESQSGKDLKYIYKLLRLFALDPKIYAISSWSAIGWVNAQKNAVVDSAHGILKKPIYLGHREYVVESAKTNWVMHFDPVNFGYISGKWIIPAGIGISNDQGEYIGTLTIGFEIFSLSRVLYSLIKDQNLSYAIIDPQSMQIVLEAPNQSIVSNKPILYALQNIDFRYIKTVSHTPMFGMGDSYVFLKLDKLPFILCVYNSIKKGVSYKALIHSFLANITEISFLFIIIILLIVIFYRGVLKPMLQLSQAAHLISRGSTEVEIPKVHSMEASDLAIALNNVKTLLERERKLSALISKAHVNLAIAKDGLEEKVRARTQELEDALSTKTIFLNNISHEIRTPTQGIMSISRVLVEYWQDFSNERRKELAILVSNNAMRLFTLVNNVLNLAKFDLVNMQLYLEKVNIVSLSSEVLKDCKIYTYGKDLDIILETHDKDKIYALVDKEKITQVLYNLVVNAIKFSSKGKIILEIKETELDISDIKVQGLYISITDEGLGIPATELDHIFESFIQSSNTKSKISGIGLGLSICRRIVKAHGGRIWAGNNIPHGAKFTFIIPMGNIDDPKYIIESHTFSAKDNTQLSHTKKAIILAIDDEEICLTSLEMLLYGTNYTLIKANNGYTGLKYLEDYKIDLILLDIMLPDIDGLVLLETIKKNTNFTHIPVILQTGILDFDRELYMDKISDYIRKPYQREEILEVVNRVINKSVTTTL